MLCQRFLNHMVRGIVQMEKSICQENLAHNLLQRSSHRELAEYNVACFLAETTLKSTPCFHCQGRPCPATLEPLMILDPFNALES